MYCIPYFAFGSLLRASPRGLPVPQLGLSGLHDLVFGISANVSIRFCPRGITQMNGDTMEKYSYPETLYKPPRIPDYSAFAERKRLSGRVAQVFNCQSYRQNSVPRSYLARSTTKFGCPRSLLLRTWDSTPANIFRPRQPCTESRFALAHQANSESFPPIAPMDRRSVEIRNIELHQSTQAH
jgi:hypothetical protein